MSQLLDPRELRVRLVRRYLKLPGHLTAKEVFEHCARELGIPCAHDAARADDEDDKNKALNIDPPYFKHFFDKADELEKQGLLSS